jgi:hypothetical protein
VWSWARSCGRGIMLTVYIESEKLDYEISR